MVELIDAVLDPGKHRALDAAITAHLLSELPRTRRLLLERMGWIAASGCTPIEAQAITYQVIEEQKRTLDPDKRRRLTNVLVNGLQEEEWDKAKHRLLIRLVSEIESEHVMVLNGLAGGRRLGQPEIDESTLSPEEQVRRAMTWKAIRPALVRELIARGLITEMTDSKVTASPYPAPGQTVGRPKVELNQRTAISELGRELLELLRDPDE